MKIVHFSDLHLDVPFAWMGVAADVARERRNAQRRVLQRIALLVVDEDADALFCGGDLYEHDLFTPDTSAFLRDVFGGLAPRRVYLAPGNHDWLGPDSLYATESWPGNVHIFDEDRLQPVTLDDGLTLWGAAHRAPANTDGFLDGFRVDRSGVHIALFHGAELGSLHFEAEGKQPHAPFREAQLTQAGLHHAFVGHYHRARQTQLITYPGNPEPLSFGEDGGRGAVLATIGGDGSIQRQTYDVAETAVSDITVDVSGCGSRTEIVTAVEQALKQHRGIVRATIVGDVGADVDVQRSDLQGLRLPDIDACQYQLQLSAAYDLDAITHEKTVRGEFVREVREAQLDPNVERRVLVTGLRALAGRRDLEVS